MNKHGLQASFDNLPDKQMAREERNKKNNHLVSNLTVLFTTKCIDGESASSQWLKIKQGPSFSLTTIALNTGMDKATNKL